MTLFWPFVHCKLLLTISVWSPLCKISMGHHLLILACYSIMFCSFALQKFPCVLLYSCNMRENITRPVGKPSIMTWLSLLIPWFLALNLSEYLTLLLCYMKIVFGSEDTTRIYYFFFTKNIILFPNNISTQLSKGWV